MRAEIGSLPAQKVGTKGWVTFTGLTTATIRDSYNVSSVTYNATGDYSVNWARKFGYGSGAAGYAVFAICKNSAGVASVTACIDGAVAETSAYDSSFVRLISSNNGTTQDADLMSVVAIGP